MVPYTPKNYPWKPTTGYESIDAYLVPPYPITDQRVTPCYVPDGIITTPLKFPNLVTGYNRNPLHVARAALSTRYECCKWYENQKSLLHEVATSLDDSKPIKENLDNLVKQEKEKLKALQNSSSNETIAKAVKICQENIRELSSRLKKIICENEGVQECKRVLQLCAQNTEAPLQISQECLGYRESRNRSQLVNDSVEKALIKEAELFRQSIKEFEKCLERCEPQLLQGRSVQNELENFIRTIQWIVCVDKSEDEIFKLSESKPMKEQTEQLLKRSDAVISNLQHFQKQIRAEVKEVTGNVLKSWTETNDSFDIRYKEVKKARNEYTSCLDKIKNEIFEIERNLKYLKANGVSGDLQQADDQLKSLLRTRTNLESEITFTTDSLFIEKHNCMAMRKCYPISIITSVSSLSNN